jgi:hypothetical protein
MYPSRLILEWVAEVGIPKDFPIRLYVSYYILPKWFSHEEYSRPSTSLQRLIRLDRVNRRDRFSMKKPLRSSARGAKFPYKTRVKRKRRASSITRCKLVLAIRCDMSSSSWKYDDNLLFLLSVIRKVREYVSIIIFRMVMYDFIGHNLWIL